MNSNGQSPADENDILHSVPKLASKLTKFEKEVYDYIKKHGEILTSSMPIRMSGIIPALKNNGVIEVFKKRTSRWAEKKRKFVRIKSSGSN